VGWIFSGTKIKRSTRLVRKPMHLNLVKEVIIKI